MILPKQDFSFKNNNSKLKMEMNANKPLDK